MIPFRSVVLAAGLVLVTGAPLLGQSRRERDIEREIERAMSQVGRVIEQSIDQAMRSIEHSFSQFDRDRDGVLQQGSERLDTTMAFPRDGVVDLTNVSGDITVTGWDRAEARVQASTSRGRLRWRFSSSRITVEIEPVRGRTGDSPIEVSVPQGVRVITRSTSGDLTIRGVNGPVDASTTSGDVELADASERVELKSVSGDVRAVRVRGEIEANSVSGEVELDDIEGRAVRVESTSGDLVLTNVRSPDVSAETVSGEVVFRGPIERGGQYEFHSHSGGVTLTVPATVSARVSVETFSGELDSAFPVTLQPDRNRTQSRRLEFVLGGGDARVIAETFSGDIEIRRDNR